jgi:hypothetical protein
MSQGKAFTLKERESIIESLKPFLEIGLSRNKACESIGLDPTTLSKWVQADESLSMKLQGMENTLNYLVLANISSAIQAESEMTGNRKEMSQWYAERRMKKEFSTRTENTGADGSPLVISFDNAFTPDTKNNSTE